MNEISMKENTESLSGSWQVQVDKRTLWVDKVKIIMGRWKKNGRNKIHGQDQNQMIIDHVDCIVYHIVIYNA